jgi:hypothetical protein
MTSIGLHGVMSQKIQFFISTVVRTSDPTQPESGPLSVLVDKFRTNCLSYEIFVMLRTYGERRSVWSGRIPL